jgi:hypothetical protein
VKTYRVKDWNENFENNKSRERETCSYVCVPNKQHGLGFARIMAEPDGAAIYGVWQLILGACSQQKKVDGKGREGWLTHDGHQTGTAWAPDDLAVKFRRPESEIVRALEVLSSEKVGWLVFFEVAEPLTLTQDIITSARPVPAKCPSSAPEEKRIEEKEEKKIPSASPPGSLHQAFIKGWCDSYETAWGLKYAVDGGKDGKATKQLLGMGITIVDLLEIAKSAWIKARTGNHFNCKQAASIHGFRDRFNQIRAELKSANGSPSQQRNAEIAGNNDRHTADIVGIINRENGIT